MTLKIFDLSKLTTDRHYYLVVTTNRPNSEVTATHKNDVSDLNTFILDYRIVPYWYAAKSCRNFLGTVYFGNEYDTGSRHFFTLRVEWPTLIPSYDFR